MTPDQKRELLEAAAKACGEMRSRNIHTGRLAPPMFNPLDNSADCAAMCAKLKINTFFYESLPRVECSCEDSGNEQVIRCYQSYATEADREAAWRLAATKVAAKTQGGKE